MSDATETTEPRVPSPTVLGWSDEVPIEPGFYEIRKGEEAPRVCYVSENRAATATQPPRIVIWVEQKANWLDVFDFGEFQVQACRYQFRPLEVRVKGAPWPPACLTTPDQVAEFDAMHGALVAIVEGLSTSFDRIVNFNIEDTRIQKGLKLASDHFEKLLDFVHSIGTVVSTRPHLIRELLGLQFPGPDFAFTPYDPNQPPLPGLYLVVLDTDPDREIDPVENRTAIGDNDVCLAYHYRDWPSKSSTWIRPGHEEPIRRRVLGYQVAPRDLRNPPRF